MHDSVYGALHGECLDFWLHFLPQGSVTANFLYNHPKNGMISEPVPGLILALQEEFRKACLLLNQGSDRGLTEKARHFFTYLLHEVIEFLMSADLADQAVDERSVVEEVKRYAMEHLTDRLTLIDLAKAAGYSSFHFHRIFLEAEGVTPRAFVEAQRIKNACALLKAGHSVTSAALDSGFSSPSQFNQVFKKKFQISPTDWIKTTR
jgi:AraC-like DNA-binding protein